MRCTRSPVLLLLLGAWLAACAPDPEPTASRGSAAPPAVAAERPVVDALDRVSADARRARVSDPAYDLRIDLQGAHERYSGTVTLRFGLADADSDLSVDFGGGEVHAVQVNDAPVEVRYNGFFITLPAAALRQGANAVTIEFGQNYGADGTGLHRFVDPEDGRVYLYTYLWPYYANRLFPCFDQPNLKASIDLEVRAPADWIVVSAGAATMQGEPDGSALWRFATTPPIPTYVFSLHAGPWHVWEQDAGGVPLRLMARRSLAPHVAAEEWLEITRRGMAFYNTYFDIPYPFGKYDQLIVPDFNIGGMENIAAVTFSEDYVERQASDRAERENRASVILHELAHMWFGDLVTHEWWNGLWLNESFATQMAAISAAAVTEFDDTWHGFFTRDKRAAYLRDSRVTTHPIEGPVDSTADFFNVFDAITYDKGSSVLKQLAHLVGEEAYRQGVSSYLKAFAYRTTELEDFIAHQQRASGVDLGRWAREWLYRPGFNTLVASARCEDGVLQSLHIAQTAPAEHPVLRRHKVDVALYRPGEDGRIGAPEIIPLEIDGALKSLDIAEPSPCPVLINPNHNDWTFARMALDAGSVAVLAEQHGTIPDPLERSMFLAALEERALDGAMPLAEFVAHAMRLAGQEPDIRVQQQLSDAIVRTVALMQRLRPETDAALQTLLPQLEELALKQAAAAAAPDLKRNWFNTWIGVVSTPAGLDTVRALLGGTLRAAGVDISADIRWQLLAILARNGTPDATALLERERAADSSDFAAKRALQVEAALPEAAAKAKWLGELRQPRELQGLASQRAVMSGLFPPEQTALQYALLPDILEALPALDAGSDPYFISSYAGLLLRPMCREQSAALMQQALDEHGATLGSTAARFLKEALQADRECLALRGVEQ